MAMPSLLYPALAVLTAGAFLALGCGRPESAADRQLAELREQVTKMEAEHDKVDARLGALELAAADENSPGASVTHRTMRFFPFSTRA